MSLLPSKGPETSTAQEGELQVLGVDEEVAPVFDALSSDTARDVLNAIYEEPGTPSEIADRLDMSIQKVSYHLGNLADVDLIAVAGTRYSAKGQEMTVYEPPEEPLVLFVGTEDRKRTLRSLVKRIVPTLGVLAVASAVVQSVSGGGFDVGSGGQESAPRYEDREPSGDAGGMGAESTEQAAAGPEDAATESAQIASDGTDAPAATGTPQESTGGMQVAQETETPLQEATEMPSSGGDGGLGASANESATTTAEVTEELARSPDGAVDAVVSIEPGLAFFLGGLFVIAVVGLVWYATAR